MRNGIHFLYGATEPVTDFEERIRTFSALGFDCVELPPDPFLDDSTAAVELVRYAASLGTEVVFSCGFPADCDMASDEANIRNNGVRRLERILSVMEQAGIRLLGGTCCTKWPSYRTLPITVEQKKALTQRTAEVFAAAAATLEQRGITIALEPVNRFEGFLLNTAGEACAFCELVGNPNVGIMLDGFHMSVEENSIPQAIVSSAKWLRHMHLAENNRRLPGRGSLDWDAVFAALREANYTGRLDIEAFENAGGSVSASVALWRELQAEDAEASLKKSLAFIKSMAAKHAIG